MACVYLAQNGVEAIEAFERLAPEISVVVLDMTMPEMGGDQSLRLLRGLSPRVPKALLSSEIGGKNPRRAELSAKPDTASR